MIEVLKEIGDGLLVGVSGVFIYLLAMWLLFSLPAWVIGTSIGLGFVWGLGRLFRGGSF